MKTAGEIKKVIFGHFFFFFALLFHV
jgi:hypothetical protein